MVLLSFSGTRLGATDPPTIKTQRKWKRFTKLKFMKLTRKNIFCFVVQTFSFPSTMYHSVKLLIPYRSNYLP